MRAIAVPIVIDGESAEATVTYDKDGARVAVDGAAPATTAACSKRGTRPTSCATAARPACASRIFPRASAAAGAGDGVIKAPMHGKVLELLVGVGDRVASASALPSSKR